MKIRTTLRGGRLGANHNQTVLKVRTGLEAGRLGANHSEQLRVRS